MRNLHLLCIQYALNKPVCASGATLPALLKLLQYVKRTQDCSGVPHPEDFPPPTRNLHLLCDLGLAIAPQIVRLMDPHAELSTSFPATIPLPSAFYKAARGTPQERQTLTLELGLLSLNECH